MSVRRSTLLASFALLIGAAALRQLLRKPIGVRGVELQAGDGRMALAEEHDPAATVWTKLKLEAVRGLNLRHSGDEWIVALHCPSSAHRVLFLEIGRPRWHVPLVTETTGARDA